MERDGQLDLYDRVAARLKEAHTLIRTAELTQETRKALTRRLLVITAAAKHDVVDADRRLDRLIEDIEEGRFPADGHSDSTT